MTSRRAPVGPPARWAVWVYTCHLTPPYPDPPCDNGHQVGHYTGIAPGLLPDRLNVQKQGGPHAARLLQVQKAAGGTFELVSVERGTHDRETALKYRGASRRCSWCKAGPDSAAGPGWVVILHLDQAGSRSAGTGGQGPKMTHWSGFLPDTGALYAALEQGGRAVTGVLQVPDAREGTWRLVSAERAGRDRVSWFSERRAAQACPVCSAERAQARAVELLAAIERGEVADRFHPVKGWAARWYIRRGQPVVSAGPGGDLGRNVTATAAALVRRGLARRADGPPAGAGEQAQRADRPYVITQAGEGALGRARAPRRTTQRKTLPGIPAATLVPARRPRTDGLPVTRRGGLWLSKMTDKQRDEVGAMTRAMVREHNALRTHDHPRRAERIRSIRGLPPPDEWATPARPPAAMPVPAATATPRNNARPRWLVTDSSWPSTVSDGIEAAISQAGSRARPAASSRQAALRLGRGSAR